MILGVFAQELFDGDPGSLEGGGEGGVRELGLGELLQQGELGGVEVAVGGGEKGGSVGGGFGVGFPGEALLLQLLVLQALQFWEGDDAAGTDAKADLPVGLVDVGDDGFLGDAAGLHLGG